MSDAHEEINKAIGSHGLWKAKLRKAIDTGESESTPEKVKQDCNCSFGKWLHERIDAEYKNSPFYKEVVDLHAHFHEKASAILDLALKGEKEKANNQMAIGGEFTKCSAALTKKMKEWQSALH